MGRSIREKSLEVMSGKKRAFHSASWVDLCVFPAQVWHSPDCSVPSRLFNLSLAWTDLGFTVTPLLQIRARSVCGWRGPGRQGWGTMCYVNKGLCSPSPGIRNRFRTPCSVSLQIQSVSPAPETLALPGHRRTGAVLTLQNSQGAVGAGGSLGALPSP